MRSRHRLTRIGTARRRETRPRDRALGSRSSPRIITTRWDAASISAQAISGCSRAARLIRIQAAWRRAVSCRALAAANYSCYLPSSPNVTGADQHYHRRHRDAWMLDRQAAAAPESAGSGRSALECLGPDSTRQSEVRRAGARRRLAGWTLSNGALAACGCRRRCCAA